MSTASGRTVETEVRSSDGTSIAFEQSGRGPALILVSSALADRSDTRKLAGILAGHFTVINYDRRGRGASSDGASYAVEREVEDIAALIGHAGGSASVFGSSSGAVLALRAAAAGLDVDRLALYEPPFSVTRDDFGPPEGFAGHIGTLLAEDRRSEAVKAFMVQAQNMPAFMVGSMRLMPGVWRTLTGMAHTLPYDLAVMGDTQRGRPLEPKPWSAVRAGPGADRIQEPGGIRTGRTGTDRGTARCPAPHPEGAQSRSGRHGAQEDRPRDHRVPRGPARAIGVPRVRARPPAEAVPAAVRASERGDRRREVRQGAKRLPRPPAVPHHVRL